MLRTLLPCYALLALPVPSSQEAAMHGPDATPAAPHKSNDRERAAQGPMPDAVSAAENSAPVPPADSPEEARGRRTLSTAFVGIGPDGILTVERRDGRVLVLRDVIMRRRDYCGRALLGGKPGGRYCGAYADVAAARPGGAPATD